MSESINCLMLRTADSREFFTHAHYFSHVVEFAKTCSAEVSVVKATNVKVMELEELARSICDHNKSKQPNSYEVVEVKLSPVGELNTIRTRRKILAQADIIASHIQQELLAGREVSLNDLERKFNDFSLSKPALCNHMARVKKQLMNEGKSVVKLKRGVYRLGGINNGNECTQPTNLSS